MKRRHTSDSLSTSDAPLLKRPENVLVSCPLCCFWAKKLHRIHKFIIFQNNPIHIQPHMQTVRRSQGSTVCLLSGVSLGDKVAQTNISSQRTLSEKKEELGVKTKRFPVHTQTVKWCFFWGKKSNSSPFTIFSFLPLRHLGFFTSRRPTRRLFV